MAQSGKLGSASVSAASHTTVYQVPALGVSFATVNINLVNTGASAISTRLALGATANPSAADYIEYNFILQPGEVLERTGQVLSPGERVIVFSDLAGAVVRVHGIEEEV